MIIDPGAKNISVYFLLICILGCIYFDTTIKLNLGCISIFMFVCFVLQTFCLGFFPNKGVSSEHQQQWQHLPRHPQRAVEPGSYYF